MLINPRIEGDIETFERGMFMTGLKALQMDMGRTDWLKRAILSSDTSVTYVANVRFTNVDVSRKWLRLIRTEFNYFKVLPIGMLKSSHLWIIL